MDASTHTGIQYQHIADYHLLFLFLSLSSSLLSLSMNMIVSINDKYHLILQSICDYIKDMPYDGLKIGALNVLTTLSGSVAVVKFDLKQGKTIFSRGLLLFPNYSTSVVVFIPTFNGGLCTFDVLTFLRWTIRTMHL